MHGDEGTGGVLSLTVDGARDELLPGASFAYDEHRTGYFGDAADAAYDFHHLR